jgi:hypothetical protein
MFNISLEQVLDFQKAKVKLQSKAKGITPLKHKIIQIMFSLNQFVSMTNPNPIQFKPKLNLMK